MTKLVKIAAAVTCAGLPIITNAGLPALPLAEKGKPEAEIVIGEKAPVTVQFAAGELRKFIRMISGAELAIVPSPSTTGNTKIVLATPGSNPKIRALFGDDLKYLEGADGFAVRRRNNSIYIIANIPRGVLNGCYSFLEKNSDLIFARPGPDGTVYSRNQDLSAAYADYREKPVFKLRGWHLTCVSGHTHQATELWLTRTLCNYIPLEPQLFGKLSPRRREQGFILDFGGGHNLKRFLPNKKYFKSHPEYYGMINGQRQPIGRDTQLCFTNPEMVKTFTREILHWLKMVPDDVRLFNIKIEDNWNCCECPDCQKPLRLPDGRILSPKSKAFRSTQFFMFLNAVARILEKKRPELMICTLAYLFSAIPPEVAINPNIYIQFCPFVRNDEKYPVQSRVNREWEQRIRAWTKVTPNIIWREYYGCAASFPRPIAVPTAKDLQFINGLGVSCVLSETPPDSPKVFRKEKLSDYWDASAMQYWLLNKLFWNPFADLDSLREEYLTRAYRKAAPQMRQYYALIRKSWFAEKTPAKYNDSPYKMAELHIKKAGIAGKCEKLLTQALQNAVNPGSRKLVKAQLVRFNAWKKYLAKHSTPTIDIPFTDTPPAGFDFSAGQWRHAAVIDGLQIMNGQGKPAKYQTVVKLLCDRNNLYAGFECSDPEPGALHARTGNSAGERWTPGDHCEIFIGGSPQAGGSYFHFAFDFKGNRYDARGFDRKWNASWQVKTRTTGNSWQAVAVIPLKAVGLDLSRNNSFRILFYRMYSHNSPSKNREHSSWGGAPVHSPAGFGIATLSLPNDNSTNRENNNKETVK